MKNKAIWLFIGRIFVEKYFSNKSINVFILLINRCIERGVNVGKNMENVGNFNLKN